MKPLYVVIRGRGTAWKQRLPLEGQEAWHLHAAFMDALVDEGFVVLGEPMEDTGDALLVIRAETPAEILEKLQADPWTRLGLLHTVRVAPWTLRLGALP